MAKGKNVMTAANKSFPIAPIIRFINFSIMKKSITKFWIFFYSSLIVGFCLAKLDTSKNWNDTGITVAAILFSTFLFGLLMPKFAWLWAFIIGGAIFICNVSLSANYGSWGAILFAFIGVYLGVLFEKYILNLNSK